MTATRKQEAPSSGGWFARATAWVLELKPVRVWTAYSDHRGPLLASGLSNQAVFAVFAAVWVAFSTAGIVVAAQPEVLDALIVLIASAVPGLIDTGEGGAIKPDDLIITSVLTWTGAVALAVLLWTAIGWLGSARDAVRLLGDLPAPRTNFVLLKLKDVGLGLGFGALLMISAALSVVSSDALGVVLGWMGIHDTFATATATRIASILVMFALDATVLAALYRVLAGVHIPFRYLSEGVILGALALGVLKFLGTTLLSGATRNPLLAGFAVIIGLLIWFTFICHAVLVAAMWVFVTMADAGIPLDAQLAAEQAAAATEKREQFAAELRAEWEAEHRPWWKRVFGDHDDDDVPDADGANAHPSPRERHPR